MTQVKTVPPLTKDHLRSLSFAISDASQSGMLADGLRRLDEVAEVSELLASGSYVLTDTKTHRSVSVEEIEYVRTFVDKIPALTPLIFVDRWLSPQVPSDTQDTPGNFGEGK